MKRRELRHLRVQQSENSEGSNRFSSIYSRATLNNKKINGENKNGADTYKQEALAKTKTGFPRRLLAKEREKLDLQN